MRCCLLFPLGTFNPFCDDPLPAYPKKQLILKIISGQQLPKPPDSMLGDRGEVKTYQNTSSVSTFSICHLFSPSLSLSCSYTLLHTFGQLFDCLDLPVALFLNIARVIKWNTIHFIAFSPPSDYWSFCWSGNNRFASWLLQGTDPSCWWQWLDTHTDQKLHISTLT